MPKEEIMTERKLRFAFNPATCEWHIRVGNHKEILITRVSCVKIFYAHESTLMGIIGRGQQLSDMALQSHKLTQIDRYNKWKMNLMSEDESEKAFLLFT